MLSALYIFQAMQRNAIRYLTGDDAMLKALVDGDTERFKRMFGNCGTRDSQLLYHTEAILPGVTLLSLASYHGRPDILHYLIKTDGDVNFVDPVLSRNALHWACIGKNLECVRVLIEAGIDVNSPDRDRRTPLIRAAMYRQKRVVHQLLLSGANANSRDRLHSSALHYASFHGFPQLIKLIIKAGCTDNKCIIFGQGTPLANLYYQRDIANASLLIEAGYDLRNDKWILDLSHVDLKFAQTGATASSDLLDLLYDDVGMTLNCWNFLHREKTNPAPLRRLCRTRIRQVLGGICLLEKIMQLNLPETVCNFLSLNSSDDAKF